MKKEKQRTKFTYSTDVDRIKKLKTKAIEKDLNSNEILDKLLDMYFKNPELLKFEERI